MREAERGLRVAHTKNLPVRSLAGHRMTAADRTGQRTVVGRIPAAGDILLAEGGTAAAVRTGLAGRTGLVRNHRLGYSHHRRSLPAGCIGRSRTLLLLYVSGWRWGIAKDSRAGREWI